MSTLEVRPIAEGELPTFSAILQGVARELFERGMGLWTPEKLAPEYLLKYYRVDEMRLGEWQGQPVATMILQEEDALFWPELTGRDTLFVHKVAVDRAFAGRGFAVALLNAARDEALARGKAFLRLDTAAARPKLRALYEGYGFQFVDERDMGKYTVARYELPLR